MSEQEEKEREREREERERGGRRRERRREGEKEEGRKRSEEKRREREREKGRVREGRREKREREEKERGEEGSEEHPMPKLTQLVNNEEYPPQILKSIRAQLTLWKLCGVRVAINYTPLSIAYYAYVSLANFSSLGSTVSVYVHIKRMVL